MATSRVSFVDLVWSPFTTGNKNKIEAIRRYFTKNISELLSLCYNDRLFYLQLGSLAFRRLNGYDLFVFYNLTHDFFLHSKC